MTIRRFSEIYPRRTLQAWSGTLYVCVVVVYVAVCVYSGTLYVCVVAQCVYCDAVWRGTVRYWCSVLQ